MRTDYFLNYDNSPVAANTLAVWDTGDVTVQFQVGAFGSGTGTAQGAMKYDASSGWNALVTIGAAKVAEDPSLLFIDLSAAAAFVPSCFVRLKFKDVANHEVVSGWVPIEYMEENFLVYVKLKNLTTAIGITAYLEREK